MKFKYLVRFEVSRFHDNDNLTTFEDNYKEFVNADPIKARNEAFNYAVNLYEVIGEANQKGIEEFFGPTDDDGYNKTYEISVCFVDVEKNKEYKIHSSEALKIGETLNKDETYDPIALRWILEALENESRFFIKTGIVVPTKEIETVFSPNNNHVKSVVIPTPWINWESKSLKDLTL